MRLIFHGKLRQLYGESVTMASDTIADAIEGFSRQQPNWPRHLRIAVVGFDTEEKLQQHADEVHMMPALAGGGGKFGSIILGAALIAAAVIFAPAAGVFASALTTSLAVSGALMIAQGVFALFMKAPSMGKNKDPEASKYLGVNKNTTAVGTPIILAWGRNRIAPHWLSLQADSTNLSTGVFPANPT